MVPAPMTQEKAMARIKYAMSCNHTVTVVFEGGDRYNLRVSGYEEAAHAISDAINRGCRVRSTGRAAGDDWVRLRARAMAQQAAVLARDPEPDSAAQHYYDTHSWLDRVLRWLAGA